MLARYVKNILSDCQAACKSMVLAKECFGMKASHENETRHLLELGSWTFSSKSCFRTKVVVALVEDDFGGLKPFGLTSVDITAILPQVSLLVLN